MAVHKEKLAVRPDSKNKKTSTCSASVGLPRGILRAVQQAADHSGVYIVFALWQPCPFQRPPNLWHLQQRVVVFGRKGRTINNGAVADPPTREMPLSGHEAEGRFQDGCFSGYWRLAKAGGGGTSGCKTVGGPM